MNRERINDGLHVIAGTNFEKTFSGRSRKGIDPQGAFRFNLQRMWRSLEAVERIDDVFCTLIERERRDIVNRAVRSQYELKWASKASRSPMYLEKGCNWRDPEVIKSEGCMEHAIPVSILIDPILQAWPKRSEIMSPQCLFASTYYVALMAPVVLLSKETNSRLSKAGFHTKHPDPVRPLSRYTEVDAIILNYEGRCSNEITLNDHIELVKRTKAGRTYLSDATIKEASSSLKVVPQ